MINKRALGLSLVVPAMVLSACGSTPKDPTEAYKAPQAGEAPPVRQMQPLQPGQPPQKPEKSISPVAAVEGGKEGTTPMAFNQPFRLADLEYCFLGAKAKDYVGLEATPAMKPDQGNTYFLVRYQVIDRGAPVTVANNAAIHLMNTSTRQVLDIDQAATNANVQSGAATGLPDQLVLETERPQIQTLAFQIPNTIAPEQLALLVTDPKDPTHVFQMVKLSN